MLILRNFNSLSLNFWSHVFLITFYRLKLLFFNTCIFRNYTDFRAHFYILYGCSVFVWRDKIKLFYYLNIYKDALG